MKLYQEHNEVESSGTLAEANFGIEYNSKIARMLSEQVYSDPILAVTREYTCNAWDAHTMVGKDEPIHIVVPNELNPVWSVRDFGPGLSQSQIMGTPENKFRGLFNTYGKSGKDDSDLFIGGFGVGSKAGFAYTKQSSAFTVTSWHAGVKNVFTAHMNENGIPNIQLMACEPSDEPSGVEISIPVNRKDISTFVARTKAVVQYAKVFPKISGAPIELEKIEYVSEGKGWKRRKCAGYTYGYGILCSVVVLGGVGYPLDANQFSDAARIVADGGFEIELPIGSVELSLSRESLSYDERTVTYLQARLSEIAAEVQEQYNKQLDDMKVSYWDKCIKFKQLKNDPIMAYTNKKFKHKGKTIETTFSVSVNEDIFSTISSNSCTPRSRPRWSKNYSVTPSEHFYIVWDNGSSLRVKPKYRRLIKETFKGKLNPYSYQTWWTAVVVRARTELEFSKIRAKLGWPPNVIKLHEVEDMYEEEPESDPTQKRDKNDLTRNVSCLYNSHGSSDKSYFESTVVDFATTEQTFYVWTRGYKLYKNSEYEGTAILPQTMARLVTALRDEGLLGKETLHCIPSTYERHIINNKNFVNVFDMVSKIVLDDAVLQDASNYAEVEDKKFLEWYGHKHEFFKAKEKYKETNLYQVCRTYKSQKDGRTKLAKAYARYEAVKKTFELLGLPDIQLPASTTKKLIDFSIYPMLEFVPGYYMLNDEKYQTIINYIKECESKNVPV